MGVFFHNIMFYFKDFGKASKDLTDKGVPTNQQLKVNGKYSDIKLSFTGRTTGRFSEAEFEPTYNRGALELSGSFKSDGNYSVSPSYDIPNGKVGGTIGGCVRGDSLSLEGFVDYKFKDQCALSAKIVNANSALTANVSGVTFRGDWALGASVSGKLNDKPKPKISFGAQYNRGCYVATLLTHKSDTVESQFSFIRRTDTHSFGGNFKANYCTGATAAAIAVSCDSCGCGTSTKFVVSTDNTIGVAWEKKLDSNTTVSVGATGNTATKEYTLGINVDLNV